MRLYLVAFEVLKCDMIAEWVVNSTSGANSRVRSMIKRDYCIMQDLCVSDEAKIGYISKENSPGLLGPSLRVKRQYDSDGDARDCQDSRTRKYFVWTCFWLFVLPSDIYI
jgi:hypothetical protein